MNSYDRNKLTETLGHVLGAISNHKAEQMEQSREAYRTFKAKANSHRTPTQKIADFVTTRSGTFAFLTINVLFFTCWVLVNSGALPIFPIFDPFPFVMLTTIVSLEAIILAIFVLMSQSREADIADLREEVDFQVNVQAEHEITKCLEMLQEIQQHLGIQKPDSELTEMTETLNAEQIEERVKKEVE
ncbi:MAG: DUF1003 domain-containing protein [Candidatus Berkelbacteria bacterium]|nr:MAG: DUF1003 domain-containing protein [Candidatus Berkelbacteria bacterium]QQG51940.1 MAG: DUF1003 domain-containing protein [Candidatus Berkelbacteria bacterium]